ncbi:MAG TPA: hypothetical protein DGT23_34305 [Micromonosporaceae bacterium]|nr:hypothetical protein [Micromonosporaceae bacterium]
MESTASNVEGSRLTRPLYEDTAAQLRERAHDLDPGDRLGSEAELVQEFKVARGTLRKALEMLEREGLIWPAQGKGWFVQRHDPVRWMASWPERNPDPKVTPNDAWSRCVRAQRREPTEVQRLEVAVAQPRVAERLKLGDDAYVVGRLRVQHVDGVPYRRNDTWYPKDLVEGTPIALPGDITPGAFAVLDELGRGWRPPGLDEKVARAATMEEAALFRIAPGEPMMETIRTRFDADRQPVAVSIIVVPGSRTIDVYEVVDSDDESTDTDPDR